VIDANKEKTMTIKTLSTPKSVSLALIAGLALAGSVQAQSAGSYTLRAGATTIKPNTESGDLTAPGLSGTKVDVKSNSQVTGGITYMVTDKVSVDLPVAAGYTHDIEGAGAIAGVGKIGEAKALPITLVGQYRVGAPSATPRPYLGAGLTYAKFYKEQTTAALTALTGGTPANPTTMKVDSRLGATLQLGASVAINAQWSIDLNWARTLLKTKATLSTGQSIDIKLDPDSYGIAAAYRF
jgi:outer membrane protein